MTDGGRQKGSIFIYILAAILLAGILTMALTSGPDKSSVSTQFTDLMNGVAADLSNFESAIGNCFLVYPRAADVDGNGTTDAADNPNVPFPVYNNDATGGAGTDLLTTKCPGAPRSGAALPLVFADMVVHGPRTLGNAAVYDLHYLNNATEGVQIRISRLPAAGRDPLWLEAISQLNDRYAKCQAAAVTAAGACVNGCLYYWLVRKPTSDNTLEAGCP